MNKWIIHKNLFIFVLSVAFRGGGIAVLIFLGQMGGAENKCLAGGQFDEMFGDGVSPEVAMPVPNSPMLEEIKNKIKDGTRTYGKGVGAGGAKVEPVTRVTANPKTAFDEYGDMTGAATTKLGQDIHQYSDDRNFTKKITRKNLDQALVHGKSLLDNARGDDRALADAKRENDIISSVEDLIAKNRGNPIEAAENSTDSSIRKNLIYAAVANEYTKDLERREAKARLDLAKLAEMAAATMQAATAMNSLNQDTAATLGNPKSSNSGQPGLFASSGRDPASLGEEKSKISLKAAEEGSSDGAEAVAKAEDAKQKISDAIDAAEKRKKAYMLKKGLRKQLQDKLAKNGASAVREGVDPEELFSGKLNQEPVSERAEAEVPAQVEQSPVVQAFHAMSSDFSLAGRDTDEEVSHIVAETEQELGAPDQKSGILDSESLSLFARVKRVHDQCVRQKCVAR